MSGSSYKVALAGIVMGAILTEVALSNLLGFITATVIGALIAFISGFDLVHAGEAGYLGLGAGLGAFYSAIHTSNPHIMAASFIGVAGAVTLIAWGAIKTRRRCNLQRIVIRAERRVR